MDPSGEGDRIAVDFGSATVKAMVDQALAADPRTWTRQENQAAWKTYAPQPPFAFNKNLARTANGWSGTMRIRDQQAQAFPGEILGQALALVVLDVRGHHRGALFGEPAHHAGSFGVAHVELVDGDHPDTGWRLFEKVAPDVGPRRVPVDAQHREPNVLGRCRVPD